MKVSEHGSERPSATNKRWLLRQISLFSNLTDSQIGLVAERTRLVEIEKEETLYAQGDPPDAFYGLVSGRVRAFVKNPAGKTETIEILHRGDYFGTVSLLTNEPHSVTTQAVNDSILIKIKRVDFEWILKEIPEVAIHLSTTLSRRLRQRDLAVKRVFESTLISIYSPLRQVGRTTYAVNLATSLRKETGKRVILVDISPAGNAVCQALGIGECPLPLRLKGVAFDQGRVASNIIEHESLGISTLNIVHDPKEFSDVTQISPLLSYLVNLFHFVVTDLPHEMDRTVFKALAQADLIHLLCDDSREHLEAMARLIRELEKTIQQADNRLKVVVNEMTHQTESDERASILEHKVYATLSGVTARPAPGYPVVLSHPEWEYARAVRRIGREIGEVLVGLALGSGAALGLAHIGVLRVLEREGIPIDVVSGSSIGALIGALWGIGMNSKDVEQVAAQFRSKWSIMKLVDPGSPKLGILGGRQVRRFLRRYLGNKTFRDLKLPVKITACDYARRELIVLEEGSLVDAVRASVSIPAIFEPTRIHGRWLIDGGVLDPVPVDVLTQMGIHKIIAVNTLPSPEDIHRRQGELVDEWTRASREAKSQGWWKKFAFRLKRAWWDWQNPNIFDIIMHTMQSMEYELAEVGCAQADVVLHPTIPRVNWFELYSVDQMIRRGEEETEAHLPAIRKLIFDEHL